MTEETEKYKVGITLIKGVKTLLAFGIPAVLAVIMQIDPAITSLTVGTIFTMLANWAKNG